MDFIYRGKVAWSFDDFFQGDSILGDRMGFRETDINKLKKYVLTDFDPDFPAKFKPGEIMIAGRYFGGTREHGGIAALQALGVACMVAESFGRPILRTCISNAFPVLECPGILKFARVGDELEVNLRTGRVNNVNTGKSIQARPASEVQLEIIELGGFIPYLKNKLAAESILE